MKRGGPLRRSTSLQRASAPLSRSALARKGKPRASVAPAFRAAGGSVCAVCGGSQALTSHHLVPQQAIRRLVASLRLDPTEARALEHRLISDPRNALTLCWGDHRRFEDRALRIPRSRLPLGAFAFARELDALAGRSEAFLARLEHDYPA